MEVQKKEKNEEQSSSEKLTASNQGGKGDIYNKPNVFYIPPKNAKRQDEKKIAQDPREGPGAGVSEELQKKKKKKKKSKFNKYKHPEEHLSGFGIHEQNKEHANFIGAEFAQLKIDYKGFPSKPTYSKPHPKNPEHIQNQLGVGSKGGFHQKGTNPRNQKKEKFYYDNDNAFANYKGPTNIYYFQEGHTKNKHYDHSSGAQNPLYNPVIEEIYNQGGIYSQKKFGKQLRSLTNKVQEELERKAFLSGEVGKKKSKNKNKHYKAGPQPHSVAQINHLHHHHEFREERNHPASHDQRKNRADFKPKRYQKRGSDSRSSKVVKYPPHISKEEAEQGLKQGVLFRVRKFTSILIALKLD
jgi:hypothetical protein